MTDEEMRHTNPNLNTAIVGRVREVLSDMESEFLALAELAINTPSPPGYELPVCEVIAEWMSAKGLSAHVQVIEGSRGNVVGRLRGSTGRPSLTLNAHMDTTFVGDESDLPIVGTLENITPPILKRADGELIGLGIFNDKGPFVSACIAALALLRSGVELQGDLVLAGVAGEIGRGQIGGYDGPGSRGKGIGTYHLLHNGVWTDYAVVCEGSDWSVSWALPGAAYFEIVVYGQSTYAPLSERVSGDEKNAIVKAASLIPHIERWALRYEEANRRNTPCGEMRPRVTIGAVEGGLPYKPNWRPGRAKVYVDVRIPPDRSPLDVHRELEEAVGATGIAGEVSMYLARRGYIAENVELVVDAVNEAHGIVFGSPTPAPSWQDLSMWNDSNIYSEVGIPAVKYGPPFPAASFHPEWMRLEDLLGASEAYALIALGICGVADEPHSQTSK